MNFVIIVTFNPNIDDFITRTSILTNCGVRIIIVDNHSSVPFDVAGVVFIRQRSNSGIAAAQNIGIKHALYLGATSITLLDQDTDIDADSIGLLSSTVQSSRTPIAAPTHRSRSTGKLYDIVWWDFGRNRLRRDAMLDLSGSRCTNIAISSGLTVSCDIFRMCEYMDEQLFIDYVDTEWCLRLFKLGYPVKIISSICLLHEIGDRTLDFIFFKLPVHSPSRRYYRIRNSFVLLKYPHIPIIFSLRNILIVSIQQMLLAIFIKGQLINYLKSYVGGVVHSFYCGEDKHDATKS